MKKHLPTAIRKPNTLFKTFLSLILITSAFCAEAQNQTARVTPQGTWFYEYLPPDYNANTNNYPIVFFLHGLGERGDAETDLAKVAANGPPKYVKQGYKFPFILISPQLKTNKTGWPNAYIDQVIEYCRTLYRVDQTRIYLTGLSLGGGGTWGYIQEPALGAKIAASVICCGHQNNAGKACSIVNNGIPIWGFHGDADGTVSVNKTINMIKAVNACVPAPNPKALITIYPGVGHNCWDKAYEPKTPLPDATQYSSNVYDWLLQYKNGGLVVNAGPNLILNSPANSVTVAAVASTEIGSITKYEWTKVSGPFPSPIFDDPNSPTVSITGINTAGVYTLRLTVTADNGDTAYDEITITVVASVNQSPVAKAGADKSITLPTNSLTITGTGTDADGNIASYSWKKISGPGTLTDPGIAVLALTGLTAGTYVYELTVTDNKGATGTDQVTVVVNPAAVNQIPTADAGTDKIVNLPTSSINITGTGHDLDGNITTYAWVKLSGPTVTITNPGLATVSLAALQPGVYVFQLTVTDNLLATATDQVSVTVIAANQSPTADAGIDIVLTLPTSSTNITGTGKDPDGSISKYTWTSIAGGTGTSAPTLGNATTTTLTAGGLLTAGTYFFRLTVEDDKGSTGFDDVKVTVNAAPVNIPPIANAGSDQSITNPINSIILIGSGSDPDGGSVTFTWSKVSGPTATLTNQGTSSLTASNLGPGTYVFRLSVKDNQLATTTDDVKVVVQPEVVNLLPTVDVGSDVFLTLPSNSTSLVGVADDPDGSIATYTWIKLPAPSATLSSTANLDLSGLTAGVYTYQLTVTDNKGASNSDAVKVTVNAANIPPTADAGSDITITFPPTSTAIINGTGNDADGTAASLTYAWTQLAPLLPVTLSNETTSSLSLADLDVGTYTFRLTVTDNNGTGDSGYDDVKVIVNAPANQSPTAKAGIDQSITLPTNSTNFVGLGIDPDGIIATYSWTILSKPALSTINASNLTNASTNTLSVLIDVEGSYVFRLVVTDDAGASDFDDVKLTVYPAAVINQPPVADAGANMGITLPINSINLTGSGNDSDGSIATYSWTIQSGPSGTLDNEDQATVSLSVLTEGVYTLRLTVTDDGGLSAFDEATVTVLPAAINQPPTADAGVDQFITSPLDYVTLFGIGSDTDGGVATYLWEVLPGGPSTDPVISNPDLATTSITGLTDTTIPYKLRLTVTDDKGATDTDDVLITVNAAATNTPPVADAGLDKVITLPTSILTLVGAGSDSDPYPDSIKIYSWVKVSGPAFTPPAVVNKPSLFLTGLTQGIYVFRLQVWDNSNATDTDDVKVTVLPAATNQSPIVTTDADISIFLPNNTVTVTGVASDGDGTVESVLWTKASGPTIAPADFINPTTTNLTINNLVAGTYNFRLTATDDDNATGSDVTKVTVFSDTVNQPPQANAGSDFSTKLTSVVLPGKGSDADGTIASFTWSKVGGPACTLTPVLPSDLKVDNMNQDGIYIFALTVKDNKGKSSVQDLVQVTKFTAINNPPTAKAGFDRSVQLPENSDQLEGEATDDDGTPAVYWRQVSGPSVIINSTDSVSTNPLPISPLVEGVYVFRFGAKDSGSLITTDDITVTVYPEPVVNTPPTVDAGDTVYVTLPENTAKLYANAESDGLIASYKWTQISGPPIILSVDTTAFLDLTSLTEGEYQFSVTVTDNDGQEASDEVVLRVESGPNNVFTPNGDRILETWSIGNPSDFDACEINVYNRQGLRVYNSSGYAQEWNGTYNGQPVPEGVYFYVIGCPSKKAKTGTVTIIR